jgi:hypothetical protein
MIYEMRVYEPAAGRATALRERFEKEVVPRFAKHGIELLGLFANPDVEGRLTYMTRFASEEARKAAWAAFGADPEWKVIKTASEADGPLMASSTVSVLHPLIATLPLT